MSDSRFPGLACSMPLYSASLVTFRSAMASADACAPDRHRDRRVAVPAVHDHPEVDAHDIAGHQNPSPGMPCTTSSFTATQTVFG